MAEVVASAERRVRATPEETWALLTDYGARRQYLPTNFLDFSIEQGGTGTGTVFTYRLRAGGRERTYRMAAEETIPGRELTERDTDSSLVTTWRVEPATGGSLLSVRSTWQGAGGVGGFFERLFAPKGLRQVYLDLLGRFATWLETGHPTGEEPSRDEPGSGRRGV